MASASEHHRLTKWYYCYLPHGIASGCTVSLLVPLYAKSLGASVGQIGLVAAAAPLASIPAFILWGNMSDRRARRKPFVVLGFLGMALSLFLMGVSSSVAQYFLSYLLYGCLTATIAPLGIALLIETASKEEWAARLAHFGRIGGIGYIAGLSLGAAWLPLAFLDLTEQESMQALFVMGSMLALLAALLASRWIEEPPQTEIKRERAHEHGPITAEKLKYIPDRLLTLLDIRNYIVRRRKFAGSLYFYFLVVFLLFAGFTSFYTFFPIFLVDELGFTGASVFAVYLVSRVTSAAVYSRAGKSVKECGPVRMQLLGSLGRAVLFPALLGVAIVDIPLAATISAVFVLHALVGLCWPYINVSGSMIVSKLSPQSVMGEAIGSYHAVQAFASVAGPIFGGLACEFLGFSAGFLSASALIGAGVLLLAVMNNRH